MFLPNEYKQSLAGKGTYVLHGCHTRNEFVGKTETKLIDICLRLRKVMCIVCTMLSMGLRLFHTCVDGSIQDLASHRCEHGFRALQKELWRRRGIQIRNTSNSNLVDRKLQSLEINNKQTPLFGEFSQLIEMSWTSAIIQWQWPHWQECQNDNDKCISASGK